MLAQPTGIVDAGWRHGGRFMPAPTAHSAVYPAQSCFPGRLIIAANGNALEQVPPKVAPDWRPGQNL